jgi:hypothetical protein
MHLSDHHRCILLAILNGEPVEDFNTDLLAQRLAERAPWAPFYSLQSWIDHQRYNR